jgi:uncharacterized membrane protein YagU involved in acid resistance
MTGRTDRPRSEVANRILTGAIAGIVGTMAMTAVMRRLHSRLSPASRYPLPPREITGQALPSMPREALPAATVFSHFAYGAGAGAVLAAIDPQPRVVAGSLYGVTVWSASYLGWIPALRILKPATRHPADRNLLMIAAHVVWGAVTAASVRELRRAERLPFSG